MQLEGRVAFVTGAGSGMGATAASMFAEQGARVVVAGVDGEAGEEVAASIRDAGGEAVAARRDVGVEDDLAAAVAHTVDTYGSLDCAVDDAAVAPDDLLGVDGGYLAS